MDVGAVAVPVAVAVVPPALAAACHHAHRFAVTRPRGRVVGDLGHIAAVVSAVVGGAGRRGGGTVVGRRDVGGGRRRLGGGRLDGGGLDDRYRRDLHGDWRGS